MKPVLSDTVINPDTAGINRTGETLYIQLYDNCSKSKAGEL